MKAKIFSKEQVAEAAQKARAGELIAFPTETVYGLGAPIFCEEAIAKIFAVKGRPADNPLIAHIADIQDVEKIAVEIPDEFYLLAEKFFPGPLALVVQKHPKVPLIATAGLNSLGIRHPYHPLAQEFIKHVGVPLVAPSANLSGKPSPTCVEHVLDDFADTIFGALDGGPCSIGIESTVLSLLNPHKPVLLRPGKITLEELQDILHHPIALPSPTAPPLSPGMKYRHYAPRAHVRLFHDKPTLDHYLHNAPPLKRTLFTPTLENLYATYRCADKAGCAEILVLLPTPCCPALLNRLEKSATR